MLTKIPVSDLRIGMYIEKLDGNWLKHPFWKSSFKLESNQDLLAIKNSEISHLWIDITKGAAVECKTPETTESPPEKINSPKIKEKRTNVPLEKEMLNAQKTLTKAKKAVTEMLNQARMGNTLSIKDVSPLVDEISESVRRNPAALICITRIKNKDDYTYLHSVAVCALMVALGQELDYQGDMHALGMAGLLHDVGKMSIPENILNKPGKLTDKEFDIVKGHPLAGWKMLKESGEANAIALDVCLHHHEKVNGKGYPDNLAGDELSLVARMGAVCDVYDAITSDRSYKKGWDPAESLKKMAEWQKGHFDDHVFKAFVKTIGIYPTGTLVKLKSGRLGVITEQSSKSLLQPKIKTFFSVSSNSPIPTKSVDLSRSQESIASIEEPEDWGFDRQHLIDIISQ